MFVELETKQKSALLKNLKYFRKGLTCPCHEDETGRIWKRVRPGRNQDKVHFRDQTRATWRCSSVLW